MKRLWCATAAVVVVVVVSGGLAPAAGPAAILTVRNAIDTARPAESIVIRADDLRKALPVDDLRRIHVRDDQSGQDLLAQAIDENDDGAFEQVMFQADLRGGESRAFSLEVAERRIAKPAEYKAYGRFVRERRDDFAWENDRVAHRMYGEALETWVQEPLTSSGVDVWVKRTPRLLINEWYMVDDYHQDRGEGADLYSVGRMRGCGGNGIWIDGQLYPSGNFRGSRVLANGPLRVMFELTYQPWDANGVTISEVKRITLDAGQHFNRFESRYVVHGKARPLQHAAGIRKNEGSSVSASKETGVVRTWEAFRGDAGHLGCAVMVDPAQVTGLAEADGNTLVVANVPTSLPAVYYAGSAWDKAGQVPDVAAWDRDVADAARRVKSPLIVNIEVKR